MCYKSFSIKVLKLKKIGKLALLLSSSDLERVPYSKLDNPSQDNDDSTSIARVIVPYIFVFQYILLKATYKIPQRIPFFHYQNIPVISLGSKRINYFSSEYYNLRMDVQKILLFLLNNN